MDMSELYICSTGKYLVVKINKVCNRAQGVLVRAIGLIRMTRLAFITIFLGVMVAHSVRSQESDAHQVPWSAGRFVDALMDSAIRQFSPLPPEESRSLRSYPSSGAPSIRRLAKVGRRACRRTAPDKEVLSAMMSAYREAFERLHWTASDRRQLAEEIRPYLMQRLSEDFPSVMRIFTFDGEPGFSAEVKTPSDELFVRAALDQLLRKMLMAIRRQGNDIKGSKQSGAFMFLFAISCYLEKDNTRRLVELIDGEYDIFTPNPHGPIDGPLSVITRHTGTRAAMERIREAFHEAYVRKRIHPLSFAGLEDAYAINFGGGRQIYGSYGTCRDGRFKAVPPILNPEKAEAFWKENGLPTPQEECAAYAARKARSHATRPD
ncbi:MAG: hypothetical protein KatS3mg119_2377 [Rhodothalassiaceae bacterium]|nr:MAG: hypothetical protein KatS3mg119_2377 [Rhodothalassiaceae bacterium]